MIIKIISLADETYVSTLKNKNLKNLKNLKNNMYSVRRIRMKEDEVTFESLRRATRTKHAELFYLDEEDEMCRLSNNLEVKEAVYQYRTSTLRIMVSEEDVSTKEEEDEVLSFKVNGTIVYPSVDPSTKLVTYLRENLGLYGTKVSCGEGGCGACVVLMTWTNAAGEKQSRSINSCLRPIQLCANTEIFTVEGMGSVRTGYSQVQKCIAEGNGSQCGFCTPGMVMAMHGLLAEEVFMQKIVTAEDVEKRFDGNLCRCTGYRPILQSFRKLVETTSPSERKKMMAEMESKHRSTSHIRTCEKKKKKEMITSKNVWKSPKTVTELTSLVKEAWSTGNSLHIAGAFTGWNGVYRSLKIDTSLSSTEIVQLTQIPELSEIKYADNKYSFGSSVTIQQIHETAVKETSSCLDALRYATQRVASHHVRNVGTWAGNIMMTKDQGFASDLATSLIAQNATVDVLSSKKSDVETLSLFEFLSTEYENVLLLKLSVPVDSRKTRFCKAAARGMNSHSLLNAGFSANVDDTTMSVSNCVITYVFFLHFLPQGHTRTPTPTQVRRGKLCRSRSSDPDGNIFERFENTRFGYIE